MKTTLKIIVVGGAGFIGSHIVDALIDSDYHVHVIDNLSTGRIENINPSAVFHDADIRDFDSIKHIFKGATYVFHLAALARIQPSIVNPRESNDVNITGTLNVLIAARDAGVKRVIYSGSSSVYGTQDTVPYTEDMKPKPMNPYAVQKLVGELYCQVFSKLYGLEVIILRYFNVYGNREILSGTYATVLGIFRKQIMDGIPLTLVADGEKKVRDFTHVSDVVSANLLAMNSNTYGEVINIGSGKNYSIKKIAEAFKHPIILIPSRPGEADITLADISKAKKLLNWEPKINVIDYIEKAIAKST